MTFIRTKLAKRIFLNASVRSLTFRADMFFYRVWDLVVPTANLLIWTAVFRTTTLFQGYTKTQMLSYVLVSTLFLILARNWVTMTVGNDIKNGGLNQYLVKPLSYLKYAFLMGLGRNIFETGLAVIFISVLAIFFVTRWLCRRGNASSFLLPSSWSLFS